MEELIESGDGWELKDYKIFCFDCEARFFSLMSSTFPVISDVLLI